MDEIVKQAIAKWPDVPHCYGWLALDARGAWRMRDERAQQQDLPGERIAHPALLGFIRRNYLADERGRWFFQNGPQRVYVNLELTPYIVRSDPQRGFVTQTDEPLAGIDAVWLTDSGCLILRSQGKIAALDDRDLAQCIERLRIDDSIVSDSALLDWIDNQTGATARPLHLLHDGRQLPVQRIAQAALAQHFGFVSAPQAA
ncbi:DUF2946 family protein [Herminiimonas sp. CN]|uniref:DUF2946 family protein n=1 Tax=Herminiimonas sp. CN TaxID=1349818 RepID=UPI0004744384|nr:DUF2946 family protein [Herminiimonas sp. CN]